MQQFIIVDGSSYFYRAFYAIPRLTTSKGLPTNAIRGFTNMLKKVLRRLHPPHIAMVFDAARKTFRNEIYKDYKMHRAPMPEELSKQIVYIKQIPRAYNIYTIEMEGYEADDIIATLAAKAKEAGFEALIVGADKDLMQLVTKDAKNEKNPGIIMYDEARDRRIGIDEVIERFGVSPEKVVDVLALWGDTSDNIPGVKGIGEKTAAKLINQFGNLESLIKNYNQIQPERIKNAVINEKESAILSKRLAKLVCNLDIDFNLKDFKIQDPDRQKLIEIFKELEFSTEINELESKLETYKPSATISYEIVLDQKSFQEILDVLSKVDVISVDLETDSEIPTRANIIGLSLCYDENNTYYIPLAHRYIGVPKQLEKPYVLERLKTLLENQNIKKIGQNIKFDALILKRHGIDLKNTYFDSMIASYLLNPDQMSHALDKIALDYLGEQVISYEDLTGRGKKRIPFEQVDITRAAEYCCKDSQIVLKVFPRLESKLKDEGLFDVFRDIEIPLIEVLIEMELTGIKVDVDLLGSLSKEFDKKMREIEKEAHKIAAVEFNLDSPKQLQEVLYQRLKLKVVKKTETGFSTDAKVLEILAKEHPLPSKILGYRTLSKLKGTYIDALPDLINPTTGRVHTSYNQAVAATGRLTSSNPNLQNIPIRTDEGRFIRQAFVADKGCLLVSCDYSQIELRILAHMSRDPILAKAFKEDRDIHATTASEVFDVAPSEITSDMRRKAKEVNFGIIYGISPFGLSERLSIKPEVARNYISRYFARYQGVKTWIDDLLKDARKNGFVKTLAGRKRLVPGIDSQNSAVRNQAERIAVNAPLQGTAADIIKLAMIKIARELKERFKSRLLLQVHDELLLEVPENELDQIKKLLKQHMEGVLELEVPLKVDISAGKSWAEAKY